MRFLKWTKSLGSQGKPCCKFAMLQIVHIRITYPSLTQCLIAQIIDAFEHKATHHKTDGHRGFSFMGITRGKDLFKIWRVYFIREKDKLVGGIYKTCELWMKKISLFLMSYFSYHLVQGFYINRRITSRFKSQNNC